MTSQVTAAISDRKRNCQGDRTGLPVSMTSSYDMPHPAGQQTSQPGYAYQKPSVIWLACGRGGQENSNSRFCQFVFDSRGGRSLVDMEANKTIDDGVLI